MSLKLTRRAFLGTSAALCASSIATVPVRGSSEMATVTAVRRSIDVKGRAAEIYGITGPDGRQGLFLDPGDRFNVLLDNQSGVETIVHWHGQVPAPELDGVYDTGYVGPLLSGDTRAFDFQARPGTHWMHSHHGLQEQNLMAAPLIVRSSEDVAADMQEVTLMLHDFTFRDPDEILAELTGGAGGMTHGAMGHGNMSMGGEGNMNMAAMMGADLNDVEFDAFLANDRTLDDPEVVRVERGGRVRLRIINGASATAFWIDLGSATATVAAVDGNPVQPVTGSLFPLAQAQRIDLVLDVPAGGTVPILAQREGDRARTGLVLAAPGASVGKIAEMADDEAPAVDLSLERQLVAIGGLSAKPVDRRFSVMLMGDMMPYAWNFDGRSWGERRPLEVAAGERVEIELMNHSMMAHPIHLHGHHFQVTSIDGQAVGGATRDTVLVPAMGRINVAFDADNPGRWLIHCHNLYHMAAGMMTELVYV